MGRLTKDHIDYIIKDLHHRGIVLEGFDEEIIDHVCTGVEEQMRSGKKFIDAYQATLRSFGNTDGLRETQKQVIQIRKKTSLMFKSYFLLALRLEFIHGEISLKGISQLWPYILFNKRRKLGLELMWISTLSKQEIEIHPTSTNEAHVLCFW